MSMDNRCIKCGKVPENKYADFCFACLEKMQLERRAAMSKPSNEKEMTAFLETLDIGERTNVHGALIKQGWAANDKEAGELMNACGWFITATSDDGWEPGIT